MNAVPNGGPSALQLQPTGSTVSPRAHAMALSASGYSVLPSLLERSELEELGELADRAMQETRRHRALGAAIPEGVFDRDYYAGARGLHLWGDVSLRVLENPRIQEVAEAVLGPHKLIDMVLYVSLPAADASGLSTEGWHRDVQPILESPYSARYVWFMIPIDDFVAENGSTWLVPGTHRLSSSDAMLGVPDPGAKRYPSRVQMLLRAGDALAMDPAVIHSRGHNVTDRPRRMVNVMISHAESRPHWEWDFVGELVRSTATPRVRSLLGGHLSAEARERFAAASPPETQLERSHGNRTAAWPALPPGFRP